MVSIAEDYIRCLFNSRKSFYPLVETQVKENVASEINELQQRIDLLVLGSSIQYMIVISRTNPTESIRSFL